MDGLDDARAAILVDLVGPVRCSPSIPAVGRITSQEVLRDILRQAYGQAVQVVVNTVAEATGEDRRTRH